MNDRLDSNREKEELGKDRVENCGPFCEPEEPLHCVVSVNQGCGAAPKIPDRRNFWNTRGVAPDQEDPGSLPDALLLCFFGSPCFRSVRAAVGPVVCSARV